MLWTLNLHVPNGSLFVRFLRLYFEYMFTMVFLRHVRGSASSCSQ